MSQDSSRNQSSHTMNHPQGKSFRWWLMRYLPVLAFFLAGVLLIILIGIAQRTGWIQSSKKSSLGSAKASSETYTCPMHPQIRQPEKGRCPICGMPLVLATSINSDKDQFAVNIDPVQRRLANIQTATVEKKPLNTTIETIGEIQIDESRQATIAAYIDGRIERLFADYTGVEVEKKDHLAVVYSPQLYSAQVEYLEARKSMRNFTSGTLESVRNVQGKLVENSRQKLLELGMTDDQVKELEKTEKAQSRLTIYSPIGGTVIHKLAEEGKYIKAGDPIYRIANLDTVWLMLELYPEDAAHIRFGQLVKAELQSLPGKIFNGRVAFIDPTVNSQKRTVGVRVEFKNEGGILRPGDYARAQITIPIGQEGEVYDSELAGKWISPMHPQIIRDEPGDCPICGMKLVPTSRYGYSDQPVAQPESLFIPRSAVLMAGEHSVAYVETEKGRFELRKLTLGAILKDKVIILGGLKEGEKVATAGNFLIDSQMQLEGKPSLIDPEKYVHKAQDDANKPLSFVTIKIQKLTGTTGEKLEQLYDVYFRIQNTLTQDKKPVEKDVLQFNKLVNELSVSSEITEPVQEMLKDLSKNSEHLHHLSLKEARKKFKSISFVIISLSTVYRGENAKNRFNQFFCPMVPDGHGDWLQKDDKLLNPYFGSEMLKCGEHVRTIPPVKEQNSDHSDHDHSDDKKKGE